jgi:putative bacteriocin
MKMRIKRLMAGFMAGAFLCGSSSVTCFAFATETESTTMTTDAVAEEASAEAETLSEDDTRPLTPNGNLTLVDDIGSQAGQGRQFITLVTKSGNYFYLIIDRNDKGEENVHFLNMVDEEDLFALMDEKQVANYKAAQNEKDAAAVTVATPSVSGAVQDSAPKPTVKEKKPFHAFPLLGVVIALSAGAIGYLYLQSKKKQTAALRPDPDADYVDKDDEEAYEFPEDEEEEGREESEFESNEDEDQE